MIKGVSWPLTQGPIYKVKVSAHIAKIHVWAINNSSLPCWIWIIFHTIVVHDPRLCHDLDPRSHLQIQGNSQCRHTQYLCLVIYNSSLPCWILVIVVHDRKMCYDLQPRSYPQGQGHSTHNKKSFPDHLSRVTTLDWDDTSCFRWSSQLLREYLSH